MEFYAVILIILFGNLLNGEDTHKLKKESIIGNDVKTQLVERSYYYWCPYSASIRPCICGGESRFPLLTCSNIQSYSLLKVFGPTTRFPRQDFGKFSLTNSDISVLPKTTFGSVTFEYIHIKKNTLKCIEKGIFDWMRYTLKRLEIVHNDISKFPFEDMKTLTKLEVLELTYNDLQVIPDLAFGYVPKLKKIILKFNKISYIGSCAFQDLSLLQELDLKYNKLTILNNNAFCLRSKNMNLILNLANNKILRIAKDAFVNQAPQALNLSSNTLKSLNEKVFKPVLDKMVEQNGGYIYVNGNKFTCNCEKVGWLVRLGNVYKRHIQGFQCENIRTRLEELSLSDMGCQT